MRKRHLLKKAGTSLIAAALMLSCTASAYAQEKESGAAEDALEASDVIDITKKGSITIYKYDMTSAEAAGYIRKAVIRQPVRRIRHYRR